MNDSFYVYLSNGSIMGIMTHTEDSGYKYKSITIDINGLKKPNKVGKDFFIFSIIPEGLVPYGYKGGGISGHTFDNTEDITSENTYACNKNKKGVWCAALIMLNGWEIKDDYPW